MFDPQDTSRPPLSDPRRGSATDRADLDDERGWWKSPPAGGSARCEAPVDVLHRTPSFYRQGYRVGKQGYSAPRSSVSLGRLMAPPGASDRSTGRTGGASGPSARQWRHLDERDPDCDLDYVPNESRALKVEVAMNNAYAFGGNNATVILKKHEWD